MKTKSIIDKIKELLDSLPDPLVATIKVVGIIVVSWLIVKIGSFIIKKIFEKQKLSKYGIDNKKINTMSTLLVSIFRYGIYIMAGITILSDVLGLKSVLAAAGVGGVAVGFGAQSLIKDIISGIFIVMEDQYVVGDMITIDNMTGTVEEMELRVTKIRNFNGDLYIIPNGEIKRVTNHTRGDKAVIVDVPIAYGADINKAFDSAGRVCMAVAQEFSVITEEPKVIGITELGKESMNLRITAKTVPNEQWGVERQIRKLVKEEFDREGIEFFDKNKMLINEKAGSRAADGGRTNG